MSGAGERFLTYAEARAFYDRFGRKQDWQRFYEGPALRALWAHADFEQAEAVFELGCGTGAFAAELLREHLPPDATYIGVDLSATMVALARERLADYGERAEVRQTDGALRFEVPDGRCDRFVSNYVLDLLSPGDIRLALAEAHRLLRPGGRLCLTSLSFGCTAVSRAVIGIWERLRRADPARVGGCRPLRVQDYLEPSRWRVDYDRVLSAWGVPSAVLVASRA